MALTEHPGTPEPTATEAAPVVAQRRQLVKPEGRQKSGVDAEQYVTSMSMPEMKVVDDVT